MKTLIALSAGVLMAGTAALAQPVTPGKAEIMSSLPNNSATVTDWYKQNVYDPSDNKIGEIMDVLVSPEGRATALIVGVGGFLGLYVLAPSLGGIATRLAVGGVRDQSTFRARQTATAPSRLRLSGRRRGLGMLGGSGHSTLRRPPPSLGKQPRFGYGRRSALALAGPGALCGCRMSLSTLGPRVRGHRSYCWLLVGRFVAGGCPRPWLWPGLCWPAPSQASSCSANANGTSSGKSRFCYFFCGGCTCVFHSSQARSRLRRSLPAS